MSRVVVFGGTGSVGSIIIQKLLAREFEVKLLSRRKQVDGSRKNITYIIGNVLDLNSVENCISRGDIVVISLGFNDSIINTMSLGTRNIIETMTRKGSTRLICLSAQGTGDSWNHMPDSFKEMVNNDRILRASFKDHGAQENFVTNSNLEWTIVRPTEIIDSDPLGKEYVVNSHQDGLLFQISKNNVAEFIVSEVLESKYVKKVVMITS
jgi:putative NADH-flavin reductase